MPRRGSGPGLCRLASAITPHRGSLARGHAIENGGGSVPLLLGGGGLRRPGQSLDVVRGRALNTCVAAVLLGAGLVVEHPTLAELLLIRAEVPRLVAAHRQPARRLKGDLLHLLRAVACLVVLQPAFPTEVTTAREVRLFLKDVHLLQALHARGLRRRWRHHRRLSLARHRPQRGHGQGALQEHLHPPNRNHAASLLDLRALQQRRQQAGGDLRSSRIQQTVVGCLDVNRTNDAATGWRGRHSRNHSHLLWRGRRLGSGAACRGR
mmetsp:Transcript_111459/g.322243  ORF Transcript_111459/g.322243 Transcript_111459/m.322243 type:complete len:265 (-) Transcript_111459:554-1348(-)